MPRAHQADEAGGVYHALNRGNARQRIFRKDADYFIGVDSDGYEFLQLDGKPSERTVRGAIGLMGAMGEKDARPSPERRYMDHIPFGAGDPGERVALLDKENLQRVLL